MIRITNDLLPINPAYNDSIIEFETTATGTTSANISINSTGDYFTVYGINNKYFFNFRNIASTLINQNNFKDTIIPSLLISNIYDDETLSLSLPITISINNFSSETISKTYSFTKNVEQLIGYSNKINSSNNIKLLLPTLNNIDYHLTYFEGYPNDFSIYGLTSGDTFNFKNNSTYNSSSVYTSSTSLPKRIFLSDGGNNELTTSFIGLSSTINKIELYVNDNFKSNIKIKRIDSKCGIYLKWFNDSGSYSYWLFDNVLTETLTTTTIDEINGTSDNLQNVSSTSQITGKKANKTLRLSTSFNDFDKEYLTSILTSPSVEMYIYSEPFQQSHKNSFVGILINDGSTSFNNKTGNHRMNITIKLPSINTQTL
jgi:hypothetical protein